MEHYTRNGWMEIGRKKEGCKAKGEKEKVKRSSKGELVVGSGTGRQR